ncbi:hypothetical protein LOK49_LG01G00373 [Camellia lanceoleosa]|uniref:Uncharacterized protein n=1 Tax=Camellia lanceoleosa TaxID=1840588 RepID=A0ACC0IZ20_9ERIC|nr:hypothetical protein LOK49_LG01G00373 [Camellia lanceoleosa]
MLHTVLVQKSQSCGRAPCLRTSEPSSVPCLGLRTKLVFSVFFPEGREWSRRLSLSGRGLLFVAVGHFARFGARFPVFGAVRLCASVRDRPTISDFSGFWQVPLFYHTEGHWAL